MVLDIVLAPLALEPQNFNVGDTVRVTYEELQQKKEDSEEGQTLMVVARRATAITFIRPAIFQPSGEDASGEVLRSDSSYTGETFRSFEKIKGYKEE